MTERTSHFFLIPKYNHPDMVLDIKSLIYMLKLYLDRL